MPSFSAVFHKASVAPVVVRWTRPTVLSSEVRANESRHHHPARAPGRRAAARALAHGHLQPAGGRREPLRERLRPDRRAAQTPLRADSEPGRSRQGLHGPREGTLDAVIKARNSAMAAEQKVAANPSDPAAMRELNQAEAQLGGTLGRLFALSEAYPDLKANQNMLALQEELTSTENKIGFARQAFNDAATDYNIRREVFPASTVAGMFGFKEAALLETAETERAAHKVSFP